MNWGSFLWVSSSYLALVVGVFIKASDVWKLPYSNRSCSPDFSGISSRSPRKRCRLPSRRAAEGSLSCSNETTTWRFMGSCSSGVLCNQHTRGFILGPCTWRNASFCKQPKSSQATARVWKMALPSTPDGRQECWQVSRLIRSMAPKSCWVGRLVGF